MSLLSRKPMPSFTLVLTSGSIKFESYPSAQMLPTAPDYLMVQMTELSVYFLSTYIISYQRTIDLRENSKDAFEDVFDGNPDTQTIFEADRPATFDHGIEKSSNNSIKVCTLITVHWALCSHSYQQILFLIRKFVLYIQKLVNNRSLLALKPFLN
jgi:hypothetical protein